MLAVVVCSAGSVGVFDIAQRTGLPFRKSKVWPSMEPRGSASLTHDAPRGDPRVVHGMAYCIRGCIGRLSHRLRGCLVIRFLSGGRLDDRNYAFPVFFGQFAFQ